MTDTRASWWRVGLALIAFVLWAHPSLVGLPCAALLLLAPGASERTGWSQTLVGVTAGLSVALLVLTAGIDSRLAAVTSTYIVLVTAAFIALVLLRPAPILRQAVRALVAGVVTTALLVQVTWGTEAWGALAWERTRDVSLAIRFFVGFAPNTFAMYEPMVRVASLTWPGMLALQTLAGLALAWQIHLRVAPTAWAEAPAPVTRFRDFRMGDGWVWAIVAWLAVLIVPVSGALHVAGTNVGLVASTLYVLRGAAIVVTFAEAFGVSAAALVIAGGVAAALAVPLLFVVPGLCTLGITDTWYHYRRRIAAARAGAPTQPKD